MMYCTLWEHCIEGAYGARGPAMDDFTRTCTNRLHAVQKQKAETDSTLYYPPSPTQPLSRIWYIVQRCRLDN
jgi:hypothetical protein